jgi:hypothetical protein
MMHDAALLEAWETARSRVYPLRGTALLAAAEPGHDERALASLPLGEVARRLLVLHAQWFGGALVSVCVCPDCGESVEARCDPVALRAAAPEPPPVVPLTLDAHGYAVRYRLPAPLDLAYAARAGTAYAARRLLLERCVLEAVHHGVRCAAANLPEQVVAALAAAMEAADPLAEISLEIGCPACGATWTAVLEPERFLLAAVEETARDVLRDVHQLARAYGWSEAESLALSRARRRAYLDLIGT